MSIPDQEFGSPEQLDQAAPELSPAPDSAAEAEATAEAIAAAPETLAGPADQPAAEPADEPADEPAAEPLAALALEPDQEPVEAAAEQPADQPVAQPAVPPASVHIEGMDWYIIHTYSGFENKVAESLRARASAYGFTDRLGQVLIPTEEVVELRAGKKVTSKRMLYPGYVMVQMAMDDELWHHVKNTPRVTGFVGGGNTPVPLTPQEVDNIVNRQATSAEKPRPKLTFEKNESVRIIDGPFSNFQGKVDEVNNERNTLRVLVTIFGRSTPVELEFLQVEKAG
jgi:transcriptional antiterminator NusG